MGPQSDLFHHVGVSSISVNTCKHKRGNHTAEAYPNVCYSITITSLKYCDHQRCKKCLNDDLIFVKVERQMVFKSFNVKAVHNH